MYSRDKQPTIRLGDERRSLFPKLEAEVGEQHTKEEVKDAKDLINMFGNSIGDAPAIKFLGGNTLGLTGTQRFTISSNITPGSNSLLLCFNPLASPSQITAFISIVATSLTQATVNSNSTGDQYSGGSDLVLQTNTFIPIIPSVGVSTSPPAVTTATTGGFPFGTIPTSFITGRITGGFVEVVSDQTSTTTAALSGTVGAGVIPDFTLITDSRFTQNNINANTISAKDTILNERTENAVRLVTGSDISDFFIQFADSVASPPYQQTMVVPGSLPITVTNSGSANTVSILLTEYVTATSGFHILQLPNLSPFATLQFNLFFTNTIGICTGVVTHYYLSVTNAVYPFTTATTRIYNSFSIPANPTAGSPNPTFLGTVTSQVPLTIPYIKGALYMGSVISLTANSAGSLSLTQVTISIPIDNTVTGPFRLARVDGMSSSQQLVIRGRLATEITASSTAPYLSNEGIVIDSTILQELRRRYDDPRDDAYCRVLRAKFPDRTGGLGLGNRSVKRGRDFDGY